MQIAHHSPAPARTDTAPFLSRLSSSRPVLIASAVTWLLLLRRAVVEIF